MEKIKGKTTSRTKAAEKVSRHCCSVLLLTITRELQEESAYKQP